MAAEWPAVELQAPKGSVETVVAEFLTTNPNGIVDIIDNLPVNTRLDLELDRWLSSSSMHSLNVRQLAVLNGLSTLVQGFDEISRGNGVSRTLGISWMQRNGANHHRGERVVRISLEPTGTTDKIFSRLHALVGPDPSTECYLILDSKGGLIQHGRVEKGEAVVLRQGFNMAEQYNPSGFNLAGPIYGLYNKLRAWPDRMVQKAAEEVSVRNQVEHFISIYVQKQLSTLGGDPDLADRVKNPKLDRAIRDLVGMLSP